MDNDVLKYWLALTRVRGLTLSAVKELLERFGSPEALFGASRAEIAAFSTPLADGVAGFDGWGWVEKELEEAGRIGARLVTFADAQYPAQLREINDPPVLLYVKGEMPDNAAPSVAVVGTRHPTHYGLRMAETIARGLGAMGVTVVSGMARGCDAAAHKGALDASGATIAVLGTGIDVIYPPEHTKLYERIAGHAAVVAELPLASAPMPYNFPRRNRIISGLVAGVVVIEAPLRSGALQTARLALDYNREVMAVPGHAGSMKSLGTNKLLKDGAIFVESAEDVMAALSLEFVPHEPSGPGAEPFGDEASILNALGDEPAHIDGIAGKTGFEPAKVSALLLEMELKGLVKQRPGKSFVRSW